ncbi:histidine phosphatase family protein [Parahaliea mediterranea]|uniref:Histidine phosphatase family protein n=1 Tax=Parahaliea mediterranea TaxID=651086 RepID=A0A939DE52_9GAMM|nr:histidine phosphatase family protein [Parahaliea mediterranea]MBN7796226.1 histidine phosphatase family protein [Parahaliea mediterranea]
MRNRTHLLLLRHALCEIPAGHCLGQLDVPLSAAGEKQARQLRERWQGELPTQVWCSDLLRARQTADILLAGSGIRPRLDTRLREIHLGNWQGRSWDALYREQPARMRHWGSHWLDAAPPRGESGRDLWQRVAAWREEVLESHPGGTLVVAHAGSLRALASLLDGGGAAAMFDHAFSHCAPVQWV